MSVIERYMPVAGVVLLVAIAAVGCRTEVDAPTPQPPEVTVAKPVVKEVSDYQTYTGKTAAVESVDLRARVKGFLDQIQFKPGDAVKKDQVLFVIEQAPFQAKLAAAKAKRQQTEAGVKLAEANLARAKKLVETKAISVEEYQTRIAERDGAIAQRAADDAAIQEAQINLDYTVVKSPIDGRISRNLVDVGNLVGADGNTLLANVVTMDPMYVYFDVSEKVVLDLLQWRREHKGTDEVHPVAYLRLQGENGEPHEGRLDYLDNQVDPDTGTAIVRGVFPNKDGLLYPGVYANIRVPGPKVPDAVLVEQQAIGTDLGGKYVLVVGKDNVVERRYVELGSAYDNLRRVMKGLKPDERYVVAGVQKARPGKPVRVKSKE